MEEALVPVIEHIALGQIPHNQDGKPCTASTCLNKQNGELEQDNKVREFKYPGMY